MKLVSRILFPLLTSDHNQGAIALQQSVVNHSSSAPLLLLAFLVRIDAVNSHS
jgi:hypothetical protein